MKALIILILIILATFCLLTIIDIGSERHEYAECLKWQQEVMRFKNVGWYPQKFQIQQCEQYNIILEKNNYGNPNK